MEEKISATIGNYEKYIDIVVQYASLYGVKLFFALVVFMIGKRIARMLTNLAVKAMNKGEVDRELTGFVDGLIYWGLIAIVVIAALGQLGIQTASFIAILGAAGLAIGLALQGSLSNFAAGVLIVILRPFNVGNFVEMAGAAGTVISINIFTTELLTGDNKQIIIPNSRVLESNIVNFSSTGTRRIDMVFGVGYSDDIDKAKDILRSIIDNEERILTDKDTRIAVSELGESSVNFVVRPWVKSADYWDVLFDTNAEVKRRFDAEGVSIPFPQRDVHIIKDD
jgi:small conductance mechanosensitive channel